MIIKHMKGHIANSKVEDFGNHTIKQLLPHLIHFGEDTCRKAVSAVCGEDFVSKPYVTNDELAKALNIGKRQIYVAMQSQYGGDIIRRHMTKISGKIYVHTPRSIVIFATINRRLSNACRAISNEAFKSCRFKEAPVSEAKVPKSKAKAMKAEAEVLPTPVKATIKAPHPIPVEAQVLDAPMKVPAAGEVSVAIQPGMVLRVAAI